MQLFHFLTVVFRDDWVVFCCWWTRRWWTVHSPPVDSFICTLAFFHHCWYISFDDVFWTVHLKPEKFPRELLTVTVCDVSFTVLFFRCLWFVVRAWYWRHRSLSDTPVRWRIGVVNTTYHPKALMASSTPCLSIYTHLCCMVKI